MSCEDVFTEEERKHLEEVLHGDLDGYYEEVKDILATKLRMAKDFTEWKNLSVNILNKCKLNKWEIPK